MLGVPSGVSSRGYEKLILTRFSPGGTTTTSWLLYSTCSPPATRGVYGSTSPLASVDQSVLAMIFWMLAVVMVACVVVLSVAVSHQSGPR